MPKTTDKKRLQNKFYYLKNKKYLIEKNRIYQKTPRGRKSNRITNWKKAGIIFSDFDLLYDIYISTTHCDICNCKLTEDKKSTKTTRCLDHDHSINDCENVRNILCHSCNVRRG